MNAIADTHKYGMWDRLRLPPRDIAELSERERIAYEQLTHRR